MEMRLLGRSGLRVPALGFGTMTFGGEGFFAPVGNTQVEEAHKLIEICIEAGVNLFDTADVYSAGASEAILGQALGERRKQVLIATKVFGRIGQGPNDAGLSRHHIIEACEASLRRLGTDYIDIYQAHSFDSLTPLEETLRAFDDLVRAGKVRYIGCSNYSGWHLMKALGISEREGLERFASQQIYYSLAGRDAEHELIPLSLDQGVGVLVWSPLAFGFLSGKYRRGEPRPEGTRLTGLDPVELRDERKVFSILDVLGEIARARGVSVAQTAINWVLHRPAVSTVLIGARNEQQLRDNLAAATWHLSEEETRRLNEVSAVRPPYPYWHQGRFGAERNPAR
jgi:aryl-alcohol dehydrogenase-like predicted oxidoreductase